MLITCPECNGKVSDKATSCPHCGFPVSEMNISTIVIKKPLTIENMKPSKVSSKRKHPKLPNGFGTIKKLSCTKERYGVYPPTNKSEFDENGVPPTKQALCYVNDWYIGFYALMDYKNGVFDVEKYKTQSIQNISGGDKVITQIIDSYNSQQRIYKNQFTFAEVYEKYYNAKYVESKKQLSEQSRASTKAAYNNCKSIHDKVFASLVTDDLQKVVDDCELKHASLELIVSLFKQMYKYALKNDIVDKDYGQFVSISIDDDDESGEPFTEEELKILWNDSKDTTTQQILIMIYSGFRIKAFEDIEINIKEQYFKGGVKTKAGKNRIVPIHPYIKEYIHKDMYYNFKDYSFRSDCFYPKLEELGIAYTANGKKHTPHDCRHTFSWLADKYKVDDVTKHMLMGHSLGNDVEKSKYAHRTLEELREAIEKIKK